MSEFDCKSIEAFADAISELYKVFFRHFGFLKPLVFNLIIYSSGNFGLIVMDDERLEGKYSIYESTDGITVKEGIKKNIYVFFTLQKNVILDILDKRNEYKARPVKLFKYFFLFFKAFSVKREALYEIALTGNKVTLRPGNENDLSKLYQWYNDNELNKLAGWYNSKVTTGKLRYNLTRSFGYDPMNLMIDNEEGNLIGTIQLYDFNEQDRSCKLGIRIGDRNYWSKGYGEDAVNTILEYAFMKMDIFRVNLRVYEYNERAARCYVKCGFKLEGRTRKSAYIDGAFYDELIMGVLKNEYLAIKEKNSTS